MNFPVSIHTISLYIAHLFERGLAHSTILSYNSAMSYWHKVKNVCDPTDSFFVIKILQGIKRERPSFDCRLPITQHILNRLVIALDLTCSNLYYRTMYKTMYLLAFYAFLRLGEITQSSVKVKGHCLQISNIFMERDKFTVLFYSFKHSIPGKTCKIMVKCQEDERLCPVKHMQMFLRMRGQINGNLFCHLHGKPILRSQFTDVLNATLNSIGLSPSFYKGHSFRIGASSWAQSLGKSDAQIRSLGRWKSNAFLKYIRNEVAHV